MDNADSTGPVVVEIDHQKLTATFVQQMERVTQDFRDMIAQVAQIAVERRLENDRKNRGD
jgi:hypothetical protein